MNWIDIKEQKPENGNNVLVFYKTETGRSLILMAAHFGRYELESSDDAFGDDLDYCEEKDEYYAPEGWYEYSEHNDEYSYIYFSGIAITHWMNKPEMPSAGVDEIKKESIKLPATGSRWQHTKGAIYTIILYANEASIIEKYPLTVVYEDDQGNVWSRLYEHWHRSMKAI